MAGRSDIKAGRAYVELFVKNSAFVKGLRAAGEKMKAFGQNLSAIGRKIATFGAVALLPFVGAVKVFAQFDDKIREVKSVTQATAEEFAMLSAKAKDLGATTSYTATEVAALMAELGRAGFDPTQINTMTEAVLNLARATGTDATMAAGIMASTIRQFNLAGEDAGRVADSLTIAANKSFNTVESLGESLKYAGPVAADFNMSLEDTLAVLGALGNVGIQGSNAGTAVRRLLTLGGAEAEKLKGIFGVAFKDSAGNARPLVDVLGEINEATKDLGSADRAKKFNDAFGLLGITGASAISKNVVAVKALRDELANAGGAAAKTAKDMDAGIGGTFRILMSSIEGVALAIGESLEADLQQLGEQITAIAGHIRAFVKDNSGLIATVAKVAAGLVVGGAAMIAFGTTIAAIGSALSGLAGAIAFVGGLFASWPVIPIILAATAAAATLSAGAVALGVAIRNALAGEHGEELRANMAAIKALAIEIAGNIFRIGKAIATELTSAMGGFQDSADGAFLSFTAGIKDALNLVSLLTTDWRKGFAAMQTIAELLWQQLLDGARASFAAVKAGAVALVDSSDQIFRVLGDIIASRFRATMETVRIAFHTAFDAGSIASKIAFARIEQALFAMAAGWMKVNDIIFNAQKELFASIISLAGDSFVAIAKMAIEAATGNVTGIAGLVANAATGIGSAALAKNKDDREFLSAGTAERQKQLPGLEQQLKDVLAKGGQGIVDVNAKSAAEIEPLITELGDILRDDVGGAMAKAFLENFDSPQQAVIREKLEAQLKELEDIRSGRRDAADNRNAPVKAPQAADATGGADGAAGGPAAAGEDPRNAPVKAPVVPDAPPEKPEIRTPNSFGTFSSAALLALGGGKNPQEKAADEVRQLRNDFKEHLMLGQEMLMETKAMRESWVLV